jgi:hypothetical protein
MTPHHRICDSAQHCIARIPGRRRMLKHTIAQRGSAVSSVGRCTTLDRQLICGRQDTDRGMSGYGVAPGRKCIVTELFR